MLYTNLTCPQVCLYKSLTSSNKVQFSKVNKTSKFVTVLCSVCLLSVWKLKKHMFKCVSAWLLFECMHQHLSKHLRTKRHRNETHLNEVQHDSSFQWRWSYSGHGRQKILQTLAKRIPGPQEGEETSDEKRIRMRTKRDTREFCDHPPQLSECRRVGSSRTLKHLLPYHPTPSLCIPFNIP
jgi:hypothetical protein